MRRPVSRTLQRWGMAAALGAVISVMGIAVAPAARAAGSWLEYTYNYGLGYAQPASAVVARMAMMNFGAYFPIAGSCGPEIHAGMICSLQQPGAPAGVPGPIRVEYTTSTSFTFRALPGQIEGASRQITFTFSYQSSDNQLHLTVWSRGPWTAAAQATIDTGTAASTWRTYANNLITGIRNGDYNNYGGPTAVVTSDAENTAVVRMADGRLEVFTRSASGILFYKTQCGSACGWTPWSILGDPSWRFWSGPAAAVNQDGRVEVFMIGMDYTLYNIWQLCAGCDTSWSGWGSLGSPGHDLMYPAVARNADGRLEVFTVASQQDSALGHLFHRWQLSPGGSWSGWDDLGGVLNSPPVVTANADGRLEIFHVGTDQHLYNDYQMTPNGGWSGWARIGDWQLQSDPAVGVNSDGRLEVFGLGLDHSLIHVYQVCAGCAWSTWQGLGGHLGSAPAVGSNADGRLEVFMLDSQNTPEHIYQCGGACGWSGWANDLGGNLGTVVSVASNADGRLEIFAAGIDGVMYHDYQLAPNAGWSGWSGL